MIDWGIKEAETVNTTKAAANVLLVRLWSAKYLASLPVKVPFRYILFTNDFVGKIGSVTRGFLRFISFI